MSATGELDRLLTMLGDALESTLVEQETQTGAKPAAASAPARVPKAAVAIGGDAIDRVLEESPRRSAVVELRESEAIRAFRQELLDGLIRVDTANRLLQLVNEIVVRLM